MNSQRKRLDFTGQSIYVGLDISIKSWKVSILTEHFEHKTITQPPYPETLSRYLKRNFPGACYYCVYEAGYFGFWIYDRLKSHGINCIVVNPADIPTTHKEKRRKNDKVDARKLAHNLRSNEIHSIYIPSKKAREDRSLVRMRPYTIKKQTRCKNQIKSFIRFYGIEIPDEFVSHHWSNRFIKWLLSHQLTCESGTLTLKNLIDQLLFIRNQVKVITKQIRDLAKEPPYKQHIENLVSIPGVSTVSAMIILTELIDISRFKTLDHLACYSGIVPDENSSGEDEKIIGVTHRKNNFIRSVLIQASWVAVRKDPALIMKFNELSKRMKKQKAIIAISRKLLNRIRFVLKNQCVYVPCIVE